MALCLNILQIDVTGTPHCEMRETAQRVRCPIGMNGGQRPAMTGIQGIEKDASFTTANLAHDDAVGPMTKCGLEQVGKTDGSLVGIKLGFSGDHVRLLYVQLRRILENHDTLFRWYEPGQHIQKRCLARAGATGNQDVVTLSNREGESRSLLPAQHVAFEEIVDGKFA